VKRERGFGDGDRHGQALVAEADEADRDVWG
jgi:hypothetical protein